MEIKVNALWPSKVVPFLWTKISQFFNKAPSLKDSQAAFSKG